jgi:hypothetical protein
VKGVASVARLSHLQRRHRSVKPDHRERPDALPTASAPSTTTGSESSLAGSGHAPTDEPLPVIDPKRPSWVAANSRFAPTQSGALSEDINPVYLPREESRNEIWCIFTNSY